MSAPSAKPAPPHATVAQVREEDLAPNAPQRPAASLAARATPPAIDAAGRRLRRAAAGFHLPRSAGSAGHAPGMVVLLRAPSCTTPRAVPWLQRECRSEIGRAHV